MGIMISYQRLVRTFPNIAEQGDACHPKAVLEHHEYADDTTDWRQPAGGAESTTHKGLGAASRARSAEDGAVFC